MEIFATRFSDSIIMATGHLDSSHHVTKICPKWVKAAQCKVENDLVYFSGFDSAVGHSALCGLIELCKCIYSRLPETYHVYNFLLKCTVKIGQHALDK